MKKIIIVSTVPNLFKKVLKGQPRLLSRTHEIILVSSDGVQEYANCEGVRAKVVEIRRNISIFRDILSLFNLTIFFYQEKPDIVHSFTPKAGFICSLASFLARVPVRVHTFTGLIFPTSRGLKRLLLQFLDSVTVKLNTNIVCEGRGVWNQLVSSGFKDHKFNIIGNGNIAGVDLDYYNPSLELNDLPSISNIDNNVTILAFIGRLNKDKGIYELIDAFEMLTEIVDARLLVLGDVDCSNPICDDLLAKINNNEKIFRFGFNDDIRSFLRVSDWLVLPSYREGFPNVVLEAGAMNVPAIVTDIPGSNEIIENGFNGFIIPSKSKNDLKDCMLEVISLPSDKYNEMCINARNNICNKYERKAYQSKLLKFYEGLLLK